MTTFTDLKFHNGQADHVFPNGYSVRVARNHLVGTGDLYAMAIRRGARPVVEDVSAGALSPDDITRLMGEVAERAAA